MLLEGLIKDIYSFSFNFLGFNINTSNFSGTIEGLTNFTTIQGSTLFGLARGVWITIKPLGLSLLTLFFFISLIKMVQDGVERVSWERVVFKVAIFFLLKFLIDNSFDWLTTLGNVVQHDIFDKVKIAISNARGFGGLSNSPIDIGDILVKNAKDAADSGIEKWFFYIVYILLAIPYMGTLIMVLAQVFMRVVKMLMYMMFSPIPIALASEGDTYRGRAISFFTGFAGVCFEASVIYIASTLYLKGLTGLGHLNAIPMVIAILFLNGVLSAIINISSQVSDKIFGRS